MPRGDRTGPAGFGPMTGRGAGYCNGINQPVFMNTGRRIGRGFFNFFRNRLGGPGVGFGNRNFYSEQFTNQDSEKTYLEQEVKNLQFQLTELEARLSKLQEG
jgi:uncharacterized protein DUF5320